MVVWSVGGTIAAIKIAGRTVRQTVCRRIFFLFVLLGALGAGAFAALAFADFGAGGVNSEACHGGNVLDGVQKPERFKIIDNCVTARGTVGIIENHGDGDWHIGLVVDPADIDLLGRANFTKFGGMLVVEVIPKDQNRVRRPSVGSRIEVTGAYVIDMPYGWREIHPAWDVRELTPSPLPKGLGERVPAVAQKARRVLLRARAQLSEWLSGASNNSLGTQGTPDED